MDRFVVLQGPLHLAEFHWEIQLAPQLVCLGHPPFSEKWLFFTKKTRTTTHRSESKILIFLSQVEVIRHVAYILKANLFTNFSFILSERILSSNHIYHCVTQMLTSLCDLYHVVLPATTVPTEVWVVFSSNIWREIRNFKVSEFITWKSVWSVWYDCADYL